MESASAGPIQMGRQVGLLGPEDDNPLVVQETNADAVDVHLLHDNLLPSPRQF